MVDLKLGNSADILKTIATESIDLIVTSPPYDTLRNYGNTCSWNFDVFKNIANELFRICKNGALIIWVVGDKTVNGSESGTSFKQALYFKEIGFNIHDTMIYRKENYMPLNHNRYEQEFEYMFCFSKGKPNTFNPIKIPCKHGGESTWGNRSCYKTADDSLTSVGKSIINEDKIKGNIFTYKVGSLAETHQYKHPAMFPLALAQDQIKSWSNESDVVLDPFMGSGTTGVACVNLNRNFIGIELNEEYFNMSKERICNAESGVDNIITPPIKQVSSNAKKLF